MSDQQQEPPEFARFDELYHQVVRTDWHHPQLREYVQAFTTFLQQHRELSANKHLAAQIENARGHCKAAGITYSF